MIFNQITHLWFILSAIITTWKFREAIFETIEENMQSKIARNLVFIVAFVCMAFVPTIFILVKFIEWFTKIVKENFKR